MPAASMDAAATSVAEIRILFTCVFLLKAAEKIAHPEAWQFTLPLKIGERFEMSGLNVNFVHEIGGEREKSILRLRFAPRFVLRIVRDSAGMPLRDPRPAELSRPNIRN